GQRPRRPLRLASGSMDQTFAAPRRQHPVWIVLGLVRGMRALVLPFAIVLVSGQGREEVLFYAIAIGLVLVGAVIRTVSWWVFRYEVAGGELRVRSGLIARSERTIPLERIQTIDTDDTPLQRLFGVVRVKIETAAGAGTGADVVLEALAREDAAALRGRLAVNDRLSPAPRDMTAATSPQVPLAEGELIRALSTGELLATGATSGRIGPALALLFAAFQFSDDLLPSRLYERLTPDTLDLTLRGIAPLLLVVGGIAWVLAIVSTVLTFGGFTLRRAGDQLQISYGLLERRRSSVPLARVQAITISEGLLRQPFGLAALRIESAAYGKNTAESGVLFPLLRKDDIAAFVDRAYPPFAGALDLTALTPLPARARSRYIVGALLSGLGWVVTTTIVTAVVPTIPWRWGLWTVLLLPLFALHGVWRHHDAGWRVDSGDRLIVRQRTLARRTSITARRRLQHRTVARTFLQRRARLATFRTAVAASGEGGHIAITHLDETEAVSLLRRLGAPERVEVSASTSTPSWPDGAASHPLTDSGSS
nr:PH domain-containing protein [Chloroflexota bacterium]